MIKKITFGIAALFLFTACKNEVSKHLVSKLTDDGLVIDVWGERSGTLEPWTVYIATDYKSERDTVFTELHSENVDANSVKFHWKDKTNCIINLHHRDGEINEVPILFHTR